MQTKKKQSAQEQKFSRGKYRGYYSKRWKIILEIALKSKWESQVKKMEHILDNLYKHWLYK